MNNHVDMLKDQFKYLEYNNDKTGLQGQPTEISIPGSSFSKDKNPIMEFTYLRLAYEQYNRST
eukprot:snap_masked-scaffold_91-processed-gene-0.34-mRNA-1 protein AED:1.00 eAED:1.00 QI:0/0/0/0/1/1/2/0/62